MAAANKEGYLYRKDDTLGTWGKKYYVLNGTTLTYYDDEKKQKGKPINLSGASVGKVDHGKRPNAFCVKVGGDKMYYLDGASKDDSEAWVAALNANGVGAMDGAVKAKSGSVGSFLRNAAAAAQSATKQATQALSPTGGPSAAPAEAWNATGLEFDPRIPGTYGKDTFRGLPYWNDRGHHTQLISSPTHEKSVGHILFSSQRLMPNKEVPETEFTLASFLYMKVFLGARLWCLPFYPKPFVAFKGNFNDYFIPDNTKIGDCILAYHLFAEKADGTKIAIEGQKEVRGTKPWHTHGLATGDSNDQIQMYWSFWGRGLHPGTSEFDRENANYDATFKSAWNSGALQLPEGKLKMTMIVEMVDTRGNYATPIARGEFNLTVPNKEEVAKIMAVTAEPVPKNAWRGSPNSQTLIQQCGWKAPANCVAFGINLADFIEWENELDNDNVCDARTFHIFFVLPNAPGCAASEEYKVQYTGFFQNSQETPVLSKWNDRLVNWSHRGKEWSGWQSFKSPYPDFNTSKARVNEWLKANGKPALP